MIVFQRLSVAFGMYIEARKDYLKIVTTRESHLAHLTMKSLIALLPADNFIRVHRSYIIAKQAVSLIGKGYVGIGPVQIPVSESYKKLLLPYFPSR